MKKVTTSLLAIASIVLFSCNDGEKSTSNETTTTNMSTDSGTMNMGDNNPDDKMTDTATASSTNTNMAAQFANEAASGGMMEVEAAKIARQNAASADVKALAKMIEDDHQKANAELKSIAGSKNMMLPADMMAEHKSHLDEMSKMKGADFDKHYINMMVDDHQKDIDKFKNASENMTDAELKAFATKTLPVLQKHYDRSKELKDKMKM